MHSWFFSLKGSPCLISLIKMPMVLISVLMFGNLWIDPVDSDFFIVFIVIFFFFICYATLDGKIFRLFSLWRFNEELEKKKLTSVMYAMSRPLPLLFTNTQFLTHLWTANVTTLPTRYDSVKVLLWFGSINSCVFFIFITIKGKGLNFLSWRNFICHTLYLSQSSVQKHWASGFGSR